MFSFSFCYIFFPFLCFVLDFLLVCFPFCLFLFCFCLSCLYSGPWSWLNAVKVKFSFSIRKGCSRPSFMENAQPIKLQCNRENRTVRKVGKQYNSSQFVVVVCLRFQFLKGGKVEKDDFFFHYEVVNFWFSSPTVFMAFHACVWVCMCVWCVCVLGPKVAAYFAALRPQLFVQLYLSVREFCNAKSKQPFFVSFFFLFFFCSLGLVVIWFLMKTKTVNNTKVKLLVTQDTNNNCA